MASAPHPQIVRYKHGKTSLEVLTKPGACQKFRDGKLGFDNVLVADVIFKNQAKGERANASDLVQAFGTDELEACLKKLVLEGELQVSQKERKEALEKKKREIIAYVHRNFIDPKTSLPHPMVRLENALQEAKFRIDPDGSTTSQAADLVKQLRGKLFLKKSEVEGKLEVAHKYLGSLSNVIHKMAQVHRENYTATGCTYELGLAPGDVDDFISSLNKVTGGDFQWTISSSMVVHQPSEVAAESAGRAKGGKKKKKK